MPKRPEMLTLLTFDIFERTLKSAQYFDRVRCPLVDWSINSMGLYNFIQFSVTLLILSCC